MAWFLLGTEPGGMRCVGRLESDFSMWQSHARFQEMSEPVNLCPDLVLGLEAGHIPAHLLPLSTWANFALGNLGAPPSRVARFSK